LSAKPAAKLRLLPLILAIMGVALVLGAALAFLNRRSIAREALTDWLDRRGVASQVTVREIGPGRFVGDIVIGNPSRPDFVARGAEVRYRFRGLSAEIVSVTLRRPVLRARIEGNRLTLGTLDPIVAEFRRRPPRPDAAKPRIRIEDGAVLLATQYGPARIEADVLVADARLMSLRARLDPARFRGRAFEAASGAAILSVTSEGSRTLVTVEAPVTRLAIGEATIQQATLRMSADAPYPDLIKQRTDGRLVVRASLTGGRVVGGGQAFEGGAASAVFTGEAAGWIPGLTVTGAATAVIRLREGAVAGGRAAGLSARVTARDVRWTRQGGDRVRAELGVRGSLDRLSNGGLTLQRASFDLSGPLAAAGSGVDLALAGSLAARGRFDGLGPPASGDSAELAAIRRAARGFGVSAPDVRLALGDAAEFRLGQPLRLVSDSGGRATIASPRAAEYRVAVAGGGLPEIDAVLSGVQLAGGRATAALTLKGRASLGFVEGGSLDAAGRIAVANGGASFTASRCAAFEAERLELGQNDVERVAGRLCPAGRPLLTVRGAGWRLDGRAEAVRAQIPFLQVRVEAAAGRVGFGSAGGRASGVADIAAARVLDSTPEPRFRPLAVAGRAALARDVWRASLAFSLPDGPQVATAELVHEVPSGQGKVDIATARLVFAEGGLQPAQLSPLAELLGSPAAGEASFTGGFAWNSEVGISSGTLTIPRLDFQSPAGRVVNLSGEVVLTSLAPLVAAPGQELRAERVDAFAPLTDVVATFSLGDETLRISGGRAAVGGGRVRVETLDIPFARDAAMKGVLLFDGVQLHDIVEASPFADRVELDAKVSGRAPFEARQNRVRVSGGELKAIQPGRLSIDRAALTAVQADGAVDAPGAPPPPPDTFTDFAYQAMENLAFDQLELSLNSLDNGRMGALFRIRGRHDPPQKQQIRLSVIDLIRRRFLGRQLPLPSGTQVNLTLDTTLNLDDLLADYAEYQRLRSSGPVQP
jgi:hypothetical protein